MEDMSISMVIGLYLNMAGGGYPVIGNSEGVDGFGFRGIGTGSGRR
jgi:hypothetical protein